MRRARLILELAVLAAGASLAWVALAPRWNGFFSPLKPVTSKLPQPSPEPGERLGAGLPLPMPKGLGGAPAAPPQAMLVVPDSGRAVGEPALGNSRKAPEVFARPPIPSDSLALARPAAAAPPPERGWLRAEILIPLIAGLFACLYLLLARGLRRGPGGRGLTHD